MSAVQAALTKASQSLVPLSLVASLGLNAYFAIELRRTREPPGPKTLAVGTELTGLKLRATDGTTVKVDFGGPETTVLYVMSPNCGWCSRNVPALRALESASKSRFRFVAISAIPLGKEQAAAMANYPVPVFGTVSPEERQRYGLISTPQTIVIRKGIVTASWTGAYVSKIKSEVEAYFKVTLPELPAPAGAPSTGQ